MGVEREEEVGTLDVLSFLWYVSVFGYFEDLC